MTTPPIIATIPEADLALTQALVKMMTLDASLASLEPHVREVFTTTQKIGTILDKNHRPKGITSYRWEQFLDSKARPLTKADSHRNMAAAIGGAAWNRPRTEYFDAIQPIVGQEDTWDLIRQVLVLAEQLADTTHEHGRVGGIYGNLVKENLRAMDGLYVHVRTNRRSMTGVAATSGRNKSAFNIVKDPWFQLTSRSTDAGFTRATAWRMMLDKQPLRERILVPSKSAPAGAKFSTDTATVTVVLPVRFTRARQEALHQYISLLRQTWVDAEPLRTAAHVWKTQHESLLTRQRQVETVLANARLNDPEEWFGSYGATDKAHRTWMHTVLPLVPQAVRDLADASVETLVWNEHGGRFTVSEQETLDKAPEGWDDPYVGESIWQRLVQETNLPEFRY